MADREKVIEGLSLIREFFDQGLPGQRQIFETYINVLTDAETLLKELKAEAKWIYGEDKTGVDGWYCSECNFFEPWFYEFTEDIDFIRFYEHCPKCGRRMTSYTGKPTQERR